MPATVAWLAEEVGELAQAVRKGTRAEQEHEFADVLAWLASLANQMGIDLAAPPTATPPAAPAAGGAVRVPPRRRVGPDRRLTSWSGRGRTATGIRTETARPGVIQVPDR